MSLFMPPARNIFGRFLFYRNGKLFAVRPNIVTDEGEQEYLKMILRADTTLIAAGGNFFVGLTEGTFIGTSTLADAGAQEPTAAGGYARKAITRDATGWPTIDTVNGIGRGQSAQITFTAAGADFSKSFTRAFLTDQASGTVGALLGVSAALANPITVLDTESFDMRYELYLRGSP